jgi:hypothetical protein
MGFTIAPSEEFEVRPAQEPTTQPVTLPSPSAPTPVKEPDLVPA